jgi:hypothetical protein
MQQLSESVNDESGDLNLDFEKFSMGLPTNWFVFSERTALSTRCRISADSINVKEGTYALCFDVASCSDKGGRCSPGITKELNVLPGSAYIITVWIKAEEARYMFSCSGINALHESNGLRITNDEGSHDWKKCTMYYKVPLDHDRLKLELNVLSAGRIWVDGICVQKFP